MTHNPEHGPAPRDLVEPLDMTLGSPDLPDPYARYPFTWRKTRFPWWVRAGLFGTTSRAVLLVYLWGIVTLTLGAGVVFAISLDRPEVLPFLFRHPAYSGAMILVGVLGSAHYYLTLRWVDRRNKW